VHYGHLYGLVEDDERRIAAALVIDIGQRASGDSSGVRRRETS
jgi:hypothetical protein